MNGSGLIACAGAARHPQITYRGLRLEWDYYEGGGAPAVHTICPRCRNYGLITAPNKRIRIDDSNRLTVDEPFRCDYCRWRFRVTDGVMSDAPERT